MRQWVGELADPVDADRHGRAVAEEDLRVARVAGPAGAARRDEGARQQRRGARQVRDEGGHRTDHLAGRRVLHDLPVDDGPDVQILRVGDLVGGDDERPGRREPVERLAPRPLRLGELDVARRDVVDDGVAPHVRQRIGLGDVLRRPTDDDAELGFVVDRLAERARPRRRLLVGGQRVRPQHEDGGRGVGLQAQFAGVRRVVQADGEHHGGSGDRRTEGETLQRDARRVRGCRGHARAGIVAARDQLRQVVRCAVVEARNRDGAARGHHDQLRMRRSGQDDVGQAHRPRLPWPSDPGCGAIGFRP